MRFLLDASPVERRALLASTLGWMLDGMDVTLYAMVIAELLRALHLSTAQAGLLAFPTLVASAAGGILLGILADRAGRRSALTVSIVFGRAFSALAPWVLGAMTAHRSLNSAFWVSGLAFLLAGLLALSVPETRARALE